MKSDLTHNLALTSIGEQLRAGRRARFPGDTQGDFARRVGVSRYTWQKVEGGHAGELLGILEKVVAAFAPPRRSLFERDPDR